MEPRGGGRWREGEQDSHICECLGELQSVPTLVLSQDGHRRRSGGQFVEGVLRLSRGLREEIGIKPGDVIAMAALNSEWYVEWLLAVAFVGAIAAPLNCRWSLEEARLAMELVSPVMLVVDDTCNRWVSSLKAPSLKFIAQMEEFPTVRTTVGCDTFGLKFQGLSRSLSESRYLRAPANIALICFTSGTTGRPKGVAISHFSLIVQALAKIALVGYCSNDVYLHTCPLCHIGGISSCIAILFTGGCHVFMPKFDAKKALQSIEHIKVTSFITVPAMMADLVTHRRQWSRWNGGESVMKILNGGGGLTSKLLMGAIQLFPHAKLISAYGMTETCSSLTFLTLHDPTSRNNQHATNNCNKVTPRLIEQPHFGGSCVGKPPAHVELQVQCNFPNGGTYGSGRIITRGPHVMIGYWNDISTSSSTQRSLDWIDTGDVGWIDATGNLWLLGRNKDRIKSGGESVYPEEVESLLMQHPGLCKVVVFGIPDHRLTEMIVACVNLKDGWKWVDQENIHPLKSKEISTTILQNFCREQNLTRFKIPKHFFFWKEPLPRTSTGKLQRDVVKQEVMNHTQLLPSNL